MKNLLNSIKIITLALVIGLGVSYVSAWTSGTAVPEVINTGIDNQTKAGALLSEKFMASDLGFFTRTLLPGNDSWVNVGGSFTSATGDPSGISNPIGGTIPVTLELSSRPVTKRDGVSGQDSIQFISGGTQCNRATSFINDKGSSFAFRSTTTPDGNADIIGRQIKLSGGSPGDNKVLAAVDANGNAVWATMTVENGAIVIRDDQGRLISDGNTPSPVTAACTN